MNNMNNNNYYNYNKKPSRSIGGSTLKIHVLLITTLILVCVGEMVAFHSILLSSMVDLDGTTTTTHMAQQLEYSFKRLTFQHIIPNILIFTYRINLLLVQNVSELTIMEQVFLNNTLNTISLHPGATVRFLDNADCLEAIQEVYPNAALNMTHHFIAEEQGMYKGDICRGAALYQTGGLYFDMDMVARMSLFDVIERNVDFVVPKEPVKENPERRSLYQAFVAATPRHPIIRSYLDLFEGFYNNRIPRPYDLLGVYFMKLAYYNESKYDKSTTRLWTAMTYDDMLLPHVQPPKTLLDGCSDVVVNQPEPPHNASVGITVLVPLDTNVYGSVRCPLPKKHRGREEEED